MFSTLLREVRFALRGLLRDRGFAVTALLSIGLGVGANAANFSVLGVRPWLGRLISEADDQQRGAHPVVVVSFDYWRTHLAARADIVGRTVLINTHPMTIVGVAAPEIHGIDLGQGPSLWIPTKMK